MNKPEPAVLRKQTGEEKTSVRLHIYKSSVCNRGYCYQCSQSAESH